MDAEYVFYGYACKHCFDTIEPWKCPDCKKQINDQCVLCHRELVHDEITPQFMRPQFGGQGDACWFDDEDAQGYQANARRILEDGGNW